MLQVEECKEDLLHLPSLTEHRVEFCDPAAVAPAFRPVAVLASPL